MTGKSLRLLAVLCAALSLTHPQARGQVITNNVTLNNGNTNVFIPQFNPSLGTLLSVDLNLSGSVSRSFTFTIFGPPGPSSVSGTADGFVFFTFGFPDSTTTSASYSLPSRSYFGFGSSFNATLPYTVKQSLPSVSPGFIGTGQVNVQLSGFVNAGPSSPPASLNGGPTTAGATGTISYTYSTTAVPEPSPALLSALVAAGGLAGVYRGRFRRKK